VNAEIKVGRFIQRVRLCFLGIRQGGFHDHGSPPVTSTPKENRDMLKQFLLDESGAELAEYAVAVALLVAIALIAYQAIGDAVLDKNTGTAADITSADFTPTN
jgi:Flp pilus assembly pilin Flp